jgi:hypothetical protein
MSRAYVNVVGTLAIATAVVDHIQREQMGRGLIETGEFCRELLEKIVSTCCNWPGGYDREKVFWEVHAKLDKWERENIGSVVNVPALVSAVILLLSELSVALGKSPRRKVIDEITEGMAVLYDAYERHASEIGEDIEPEVARSLDVAGVYAKLLEKRR